MKNKRGKPRTLTIRSDRQRHAIASPLRLELIGLFLDREPLSVAEIARRMGRPATAIHYHVRVLENAGLLRRTSHRRRRRRPEALYRPVAEVFKMEQPKEASAAADAVKMLSTALRMAERDLKAALTNPGTKESGPYRNCFGARLHCRLSRQDLAELNRHLRGLERMLSRVHKTHEPSPHDSFVSLTVALMPLRNRDVRP